MMQPSGRAMHNGKMYELWGDELWEYTPDVETGETTVRVVGQVGNLTLPETLGENWDMRSQTYADVQAINADLLAACKAMLANYGSIYGSDMDRPVKMAQAAVAKAKRLSPPTRQPQVSRLSDRLLRGFRLAARMRPRSEPSRDSRVWIAWVPLAQRFRGCGVAHGRPPRSIDRRGYRTHLRRAAAGRY